MIDASDDEREGCGAVKHGGQNFVIAGRAYEGFPLGAVHLAQQCADLRRPKLVDRFHVRQFGIECRHVRAVILGGAVGEDLDRGLRLGESSAATYSRPAEARTKQPNLIVMDAGLPGMSGWDATEALKSDPATAGICVIMLTGHVFLDAERRAAASGVNVFLRKPCLPNDLHREIMSALGQGATTEKMRRPPRAAERS